MGKKLSEMENGAKVHLSVSSGGNALEFDTNVVEAGESHIIIEPIKHDDKILNFSNKEIVKDIIVDTAELPEKYINVDVGITKLDNKKYHIVFCDKEGVTVNRRDDFRVYVGSYVDAQLANINAKTEAILKDVSIGGFSLVIRKNGIDGIVGWVGQHIKVVFYHGGNEHIPMVFIGEVVREESLDGGRIVVGCKSLRQPFGIERFIADKQREELRRKNIKSDE